MKLPALLARVILETADALTMVGIGRDPGLEQLGVLFSVPRLPLEPDSHYRPRILDTWWGRCNGVDEAMSRPLHGEDWN